MSRKSSLVLLANLATVKAVAVTWSNAKDASRNTISEFATSFLHMLRRSFLRNSNLCYMGAHRRCVNTRQCPGGHLPSTTQRTSIPASTILAGR